MSDEESSKDILDKVSFDGIPVANPTTSDITITDNPKPIENQVTEPTREIQNEKSIEDEMRNSLASGNGYGMYIAIFAIIALIGVSIWYYLSHIGFFKKKDGDKK